MSDPSIHEKSDSSEGHALGDIEDGRNAMCRFGGVPLSAAAVFALSAALSRVSLLFRDILQVMGSWKMLG